MKKSFKVVHVKNDRDTSPLNDIQIQHELDVFSSMVVMLFANPDIEANCEGSLHSVILTLEGSVSEDALDWAAKQILLAVNNKQVIGRHGHPNFVIAK